MLQISLDLGNVPSVLQALADMNVAQNVANAAAESYVDDTLEWIGAGRGFTTRTGQLEQSINWSPTGNGAADVYANADYAGWVETGTEPHVIKPKSGRKALKFAGGGGFIFRRAVNHPGSKPYPFFYVDRAHRQDNMLAAANSVLARVMANG
jgi:hypothetical protein